MVLAMQLQTMAEGFGRGYYKTVMSTVRTKPIKGRKTFSLVVDRENVMVTSRYGLTLHVRTFKNSDLARSYFHLADGHMHSVNEAIDTITDRNEFDVPLDYCVTPERVYRF